MNISLLSGAVKNAGDFLIQKRSIELLKKHFPNCNIKIYNRLNSIDPYINEINNSDCIVLAGGPLVMADTYPNRIPLTNNLDDIKAPIITIGIGWYGKNDLPKTIYENYILDDSTIKLFKKIESFAPISCRDWHTVRILKNNGLTNAIMTGCPALFDLNEINKIGLRNDNFSEINNICVSDPGYGMNTQKCYDLLVYLRNKYPKAEIKLVFHRGIEADDFTSEIRAQKNHNLMSKASNLGVKNLDIAYSAEGFKVYDECDIHIGFRVHAHIYNLSQRNLSILIEEDGRGIGIDYALNLHGIKPYHYIYDSEHSEVIIEDNKYMINDIDSLLFEYKSNNFHSIDLSVQTIHEYYLSMSKHIKDSLKTVWVR